MKSSMNSVSRHDCVCPHSASFLPSTVGTCTYFLIDLVSLAPSPRHSRSFLVPFCSLSTSVKPFGVEVTARTKATADRHQRTSMAVNGASAILRFPSSSFNSRFLSFINHSDTRTRSPRSVHPTALSKADSNFKPSTTPDAVFEELFAPVSLMPLATPRVSVKLSPYPTVLHGDETPHEFEGGVLVRGLGRLDSKDMDSMDGQSGDCLMCLCLRDGSGCS